MLKKGIFTILVLAVLLLPTPAYAGCSFLNVISSIAWQSIFPLKIGGVTIVSSNLEDSDSGISSPVCLCVTTEAPYFKIGLATEFWEPSRLMDTVKEPYNFCSLGITMGGIASGYYMGTQSEMANEGDSFLFAQAHYYYFPVWEILGIFTDYACGEIASSFDVAYITEVDPLWQNDLLAFILNPEALLFGNPVAVLACMADSIAANAGNAIDLLFWCMGSWGSSYPLTGSINDENLVEGNAAVAARMIYKLSRELLLWDTANELCIPELTGIWVKSHYGLQVTIPVPGSSRVPIGRSGLLWAASKNPPFTGGDNFGWVLWKKQVCCMGATGN